MTSVLQTATSASYASGLAAFFGGLSLSNWLSIFGAVMVLLTYLTNLWFRLEERKQRAEEQRQRDELHALKKQQLIKGNPVEDDA